MIEKFTQAAQLSQAAYARLNPGPTVDSLNQLVDENFTLTQRVEFATNFPVIVTQYADTLDTGGMGTGFNATVFANKDGKLTLAIRGTDSLGIGNETSDLLAGQNIVTNGMAYDQVVAMVNWWNRAATPVGEMVKQFQLLEVFNFQMPAGAVVLHSGTNPDSSYVLAAAPEMAAFSDTRNISAKLGADPVRRIDVAGHSLGGHLGMLFSTIYSSQTAQVTVFNAPGFKDSSVNRAFMLKLGGAIPLAGASNITNVIADETALGAAPYNLLAGMHSKPGTVFDISIENQLNTDETSPPGALNHSIMVLADSLAVYKLLADLAPVSDLGESSFSRSDYKRVLNQVVQGTAGGYERIVDALQNLFSIGNAGLLDTGNGKRDDLYNAIQELTQKDSAYDSKKGKLQIEAVTGAAGHFVENAQTADARGLAWRYVLKELDPFVVIDTNNTGLYARFQAGGTNAGELDLYGPATRTGTLTTQWLEDRAALLYRKLDVAAKDENNDSSQPPKLSNTKSSWANDGNYYEDRATGYVVNQGANGGQRVHDPNIIFGSDNADAIAGSRQADRLYGGGGADTLQGNQGNDYLEGGSGNDTYVWNTGDGFDTILDQDGIGKLVVNGKIISGGIKVTPGNYVNADNQALHFEVDPILGGVLIVNGNLRIENFTSGDFGVVLSDAGAINGIQPTVNDFSHFFASLGFGTDNAESVALSTSDFDYGQGRIFIGKGGDDLFEISDLNSSGATDFFPYIEAFGGAGNDLIVGTPTQMDETVSFFNFIGDAGSDVILGGESDELIVGDFLYFQIDNDGFSINNFHFSGGNSAGFWYESSRTDITEEEWSGSLDLGAIEPFQGTHLAAAKYVLGITDETDLNILYDDYLEGGGGNDDITGGPGADVIFGGSGDDFLVGDDVNISWPTLFPDWAAELLPLLGKPGDDYIDGGFGNDILGDVDRFNSSDIFGGSDILVGGGGDDVLNNLDGFSGFGGVSGVTNWLYGGDGNDRLTSSNESFEGHDYLFGGSGNDFLSARANKGFLDGGDGSDIYQFQVNRGMPGEIKIHDEDHDGNDFDRIEFISTFPNAKLFIDFRRDEFDLILTTRLIFAPGQPSFATGPVIRVEDWFTGSDCKIEQLVIAQTVAVTVDGGEGSVSTTTENFTFSIADIESKFFTPTASEDFLWGSMVNDQLAGGAGGDTLFGDAGDDVLAGNEGDDVLDGGYGADIYAFNIGDGIDHILDAGGFEADGIAFGAGITPDMLFLGLGSLLINIGNDGDAIHLDGFNPNDAHNSSNIEYFQFADGTTLTYQQLLDRGFDIAGTNTDDILIGTSVNDRILGLGGSDSFDGGAGADVLTGSAGGDTYIFSAGSGTDTVIDATESGQINRIVLRDYLEADITAVRDDQYVTLLANGAQDAVRILWDEATGAGVDVVEFADGSIWDRNALGQLPVPQENKPPAVGIPLGSRTVAEDTIFNFVVPGNAFIEDDMGDVLAYSAMRADGSALPTWLNFDALTYTFSGTPANADVGTVRLAVTATDRSGVAVSSLFDLTVENLNDAPVYVPPIGDQVATEDAVFTFTVSAERFAELDTGDVLNYSASLSGGESLPTWLGFDEVSRMFSGTPGNADVGNLSVAITATDLSGASASGTFAINVGNTNDAPILAQSLVSQIATENTNFSYTLPAGVFLDIDSGDQLAYSAHLANGEPLPDWLAFNSATLEFNGVPPDGAAGELLLGITATDKAGSQALAVFALQIETDTEGVSIFGTSASESLSGTVFDDSIDGRGGNDTLHGLAGNDWLRGGAGADRLIGGSGDDLLDGRRGHDVLKGGKGSDTYLFGKAYGKDVIDDDGLAGEIDTVLFDEGISFRDLRFSKDSGDLTISIAGTGDRLTIRDWSSRKDGIEVLRFANGQMVNLREAVRYGDINADWDHDNHGANHYHNRRSAERRDKQSSSDRSDDDSELNDLKKEKDFGKLINDWFDKRRHSGDALLSWLEEVRDGSRGVREPDAAIRALWEASERWINDHQHADAGRAGNAHNEDFSALPWLNHQAVEAKSGLAIKGLPALGGHGLESFKGLEEGLRILG
jgi:Ca2+-binding RTX toxin-like protein